MKKQYQRKNVPMDTYYHHNSGVQSFVTPPGSPKSRMKQGPVRRPTPLTKHSVNPILSTSDSNLAAPYRQNVKLCPSVSEIVESLPSLQQHFSPVTVPRSPLSLANEETGIYIVPNEPVNIRRPKPRQNREQQPRPNSAMPSIGSSSDTVGYIPILPSSSAGDTSSSRKSNDGYTYIESKDKDDEYEYDYIRSNGANGLGNLLGDIKKQPVVDPKVSDDPANVNDQEDDYEDPVSYQKITKENSNEAEDYIDTEDYITTEDYVDYIATEDYIEPEDYDDSDKEDYVAEDYVSNLSFITGKKDDMEDDYQ